MDYSQSLNQRISQLLLLVTAMCLSGIRCQTYRKAEIVFPSGSTARNGTLFKIECDFTPNVFPKVVIFQARDKNGNPSVVFSYITQKNGTVEQKTADSMKGRATLTATRQKFLLEINPVLLQDEGNYGCRVFRDYSDQIVAYPKRLNINAIPSTPILRIAGSGTARLGLNIRLVCTANMGRPAGKLHWSRKYRQDGAFQKISGSGVSATHINGTIIEMEDFVVNHLREADDLSIYRCQAYNSELMSDEEWPAASLTLRVTYPVRDISIFPIREEYKAGDVIRCGALGNPDPEISWTKHNGTGDLLAKDGSLRVEERSVGGPYSYTCTATNYVDHYPHSVKKSIDFIVRAAPHINVEDIQTIRAGELVTIRWKQTNTRGASYKIKYCLGLPDNCFYHFVADHSATSTAILVGKVENVTVYLHVLVEGEVLYTSPAITVKEPVVEVSTADNSTSPLTATAEGVKVVNANTGIIVATVVAFFAMISIGVAVVWFLPKSMRNKMLARLRHMRRRDQGRGPPHVITVNCTSERPIPTMPASTTVSDHGDGDRSTLEMEPRAPHIGRNDHHIPLPPYDLPSKNIGGLKDWRTSGELQSKSEVDSLMGSDEHEETEP
ncbi:uncharacterized protein LOC135502356 isoform X2 [Lineus longissimus]|uniref:uncharacterized protein LOC135502356 isoform X2 n=1 Tax=Lineus longissimus TaxID=88925 RepID=UPI002B4C570A